MHSLELLKVGDVTKSVFEGLSLESFIELRHYAEDDDGGGDLRLRLELCAMLFLRVETEKKAGGLRE